MAYLVLGREEHMESYPPCYSNRETQAHHSGLATEPAAMPKVYRIMCRWQIESSVVLVT